MPLSHMFTPVNDTCMGVPGHHECNIVLRKDQRQDIGWDQEGKCRRVCGHCLELEKKFKAQKKDKS